MAEPSTEVCHSQVSLFAVPQVALRDEHVTLRKHSQTSQFLRRVEHYRREAAWHLTVQTDFDTSLNLVLVLHEEIQQLLSIQNRLAIIGHEADQSCVPLVGNLCEGCGTTAHQDLPDPVVESLYCLLCYPQMGLCCHFLGRLILKIPNAVLVGSCWRGRPCDYASPRCSHGFDADFESIHVEQKVRVVGTIHAHKGFIPVQCRDASGQTILDVPKDSSTKIHIPLEKPHSTVTRPTLLVPIANGVLVVRVWMLDEVSLNEIFTFCGIKLEQNEDLVQVSGVQPYWVARFSFDVFESKVLVRTLGWPS